MGLIDRLLEPARMHRLRADRPGPLADHEDGLRRIMADAADEPYVAFQSLADARQHADAVAILQGDDGGQLYVVVPVRHIRCDEHILRQLLTDLDRLEWNDPTAIALRFEEHPIGAGVGGGMGRAVVTDGVWVHATLRALTLDEHIEQVIAGELVRLPERYRRRDDDPRRLP